MEKFYILLIILHFSFQAPLLQRCPSCSLVCNNEIIGRIPKECRTCQCEPINDMSKVVPVVLCPLKICKENCGFMGYKQDSMGCNSCECQEI